MKTIISILTFFLFFISTFQINAQKLRDKNVSFKYVSIPTIVTPEEYKTYSVEVGGEILQILGVSAKSFTDNIKMQGFKRVAGFGGSAGHLQIMVDLGYLTAGKEEFKTYSKTVKDKAGNETVVKSYYYTVPFQGQYSINVVSPEGKILRSTSGAYNKELATDKYSTSATVQKQRNKLVNQLRITAADNIRTDAKNAAISVAREFDYRKTSRKENIYLIKKHASEDQWEKHYEKVKEVFEKSSHRPNTDEMKEKLAPTISFYEKMAAKDPRSDKKLLRIYKAATLNLATIYFYLDDIHKSADIMGNATDKLVKDGPSKRFVSYIDKTAKSMTKSGLRTIYHQRDLSDALTPGEMAMNQQSEEEMMRDKKANEAWVVFDGTRVDGSILLDKDADDFIFGSGGNVTFLNADNEEIDLTVDQVTAFFFADRKFHKDRFAPSAKGKSESVMSILETVFESDKVKLYKYYPSSGALSGEKTEFAFKKRGEEFPVSLESTAFLLWEKGLAEYFSDCADLKAIIADGGIKKTKDDLIKAARIYSEICKEVIRP